MLKTFQKILLIGGIVFLLFSCLVGSVVVKIAIADFEDILEEGSKIYGEEAFYPLQECGTEADIYPSSTTWKILPNNDRDFCLFLKLSSEEAEQLGIRERTGALADRAGGSLSYIPVVIYIPDRLWEYDTATRARIIAHEAVHLRDNILGEELGEERSWMEKEFRAWAVEMDLLISRSDIYGGTERLVSACDQTGIPELECQLIPFYLENDSEGFYSYLESVYSQ